MDRKTFFVGLGAALLIGLVAVTNIFLKGPASYRGTTYEKPYPVAPEFELNRSGGTPFQLSETRGRIVLLFFGYTSCPDVCPTTLAELNQSLDKLNTEDSKQVQVLFVTVDPGRDTPERVQEYVDHFNSSFIGLSGTESDLEKVWKDYGVFREVADSESASGYLVNHTARVTLIDRKGNIRISFGFDSPIDDIVHDLETILQEKE